MKKEEILAASRKENKNKDIYTREIESQANTFASISILLLALVFFTYEIIKGRGINPAIYSMITLFNSVLYGYMGIKIKEQRKLRICTSVIWGLMTVLLLIEYFTK